MAHGQRLSILTARASCGAMASLFAKPFASFLKSGADAVYVAAVPLKAAGGPLQLAMSTAYSLNLWNFQHLMVVIKPSSPPCPEVIVFDFQPRNPESMEAAIAVLSRKSIPGYVWSGVKAIPKETASGVVLQRTLKRLPRSKCWFVGSSLGNALEMAIQFNSSWETDLRVGYHDCRDYANELVEHLTGEKQVLDRLQRGNSN